MVEKKASLALFGTCLFCMVAGGFLIWDGTRRFKDAEDWGANSAKTTCVVRAVSDGKVCSQMDASNASALGATCVGFRYTYTIASTEMCGAGSPEWEVDSECLAKKMHNAGDNATCWVYDGCTDARFESPTVTRTVSIVEWSVAGVLLLVPGLTVVVLIVVVIVALFKECCKSRPSSSAHHASDNNASNNNSYVGYGTGCKPDHDTYSYGDAPAYPTYSADGNDDAASVGSADGEVNAYGQGPATQVHVVPSY